MKTVVPIMDASGYYIVLFYKPDGSTEIAIVTEDYCLSSLAPGASPINMISELKFPSANTVFIAVF